MPLSSERALELWDAILLAGEEFNLKVTGPVLSRAVERGVTDINYTMNSDLNALEDTCAKLVDVDKASDFIGKAALQQIAREGVKRHSVGLLFEEEVPRLEWFWELQDHNGNPGEVRWAIHSFELGQDIGIAVVDINVDVGDIVEVTHPRGTSQAEITTMPFAARSS
jgi:aminomethyltransferase